MDLRSATPAKNGNMELNKRTQGQESTLSKASKKPRFGSIYENDYIINQIGKLCSKEDLKMFREASKAYYQKLNPIFWYAAKRYMRIITFRNIPHIFIDCLNSEEEDITADLWAEEIVPIAHTFRTLVLQNIMAPNMQIGGLQWTDAISLISSHIKCLEFESFDYDNYEEEPLTARQLVEFFKKFVKLESCKIGNLGELPTVHLEMMLRSLRASAQIEIEVDDNYGPIFNRCGDIPNISWNAIIRRSWQMLENAQFFRPPILPKDVTFKIYAQSIGKFEDLRTTTQLCLGLKGKINELGLVLNLNEFETNFLDEADVKFCLRVLRSYVTELELDYRSKKWNIDNADVIYWTWPKLTDLTIRSDVAGGNIPFVIMKNSPNLHKLTLLGYPNSIIFRDSKKSDEQNIKDFFGTLTNLRFLLIPTVRLKGKDYLERLLPRLIIDYDYRF